MFRLFEFDDLPPPDIVWFERMWLATLALSVVITITMFDWSTGRVGRLGAACLTAFRFGGTFLIMFMCTRLRSNLVRWIIAIPFNMVIVAYDVVRLPDMLERNPVIWFVIARLLLTFAATFMLFTPRSRAWFARRTPPDLVEAQ